MKNFENAIANGESLFNFLLHDLISFLEVKMNSVGYYHYAVDGTCYDLYQIAEQLIDYYDCDPVRQQIAETLYEIDFYSLYDE